MKRLVFLVLIAAAMSPACSIALGAQGDGHVTKSENTVSAFERLWVGGSPKVNFHQSAEYRVSVEIDENLRDYLDIFVRNNTLVIGTKSGRSIYPSVFIVDVYAPTLSGADLSGAVYFEALDKISSERFDVGISGSGTMQGDVECGDYSASISGSGEITGNIVCENFEAGISGSGEISGNIVSENFEAHISGAGEIIVSGSAENAMFDIAGSGSVAGRELQCRNAAVDVSGSGDIHLWVLDNLQVDVSGSGTVLYRGTPKIDSRSSGFGSIRSE